MSTEPTTVDWEAALLDIDARIAKLQGIADGIREMLSGGLSGSLPGGGSPGGGVRPDTFLKMSIPDATKKYLGITREKQSTQAVMDALEKGGLPPSKYNTVYSILRRRSKQVGDIINRNGDWALDEWYPNYRKDNSKANKAGSGKAKDAKAETGEETATA